MGWYVNTLVTFDCDDTERIAAEAAKRLTEHFGATPDEEVLSDEAVLVLSELSAKRGYTCGRKGQCWAIAFTGNYTKGLKLAKELRPFVERLWEPSASEDGMLPDFHHVTIITQDEQAATSKMFVIRKGDKANVNSVIEEHELPAVWSDWA